MKFTEAQLESTIIEEATIHDAYVQLTTRYQRDIPELFWKNHNFIIHNSYFLLYSCLL